MKRFVSKRTAINRKNSDFVKMVEGNMSIDLERALKSTAGMPVSNTKASGNKRGGGGHMKAATQQATSEMGGHRVIVNKEYAEYQERGRRKDGSHVIRHYSTAGTSSGWFRRAINQIWSKRDGYIDEARQALNL